MNKNENSLDNLDLRVFNTLSGRQLVGQLIDVDDNIVYLNNTMECKLIIQSDGSYKTTLITATPFDDSNVLLLYLNSIESESEASAKLKNVYIDQLIRDNIISLLCELLSEESNDYQTNLTNLAKQDYWKVFKDSMEL